MLERTNERNKIQTTIFGIYLIKTLRQKKNCCYFLFSYLCLHIFFIAITFRKIYVFLRHNCGWHFSSHRRFACACVRRRHREIIRLNWFHLLPNFHLINFSANGYLNSAKIEIILVAEKTYSLHLWFIINVLSNTRHCTRLHNFPLMIFNFRIVHCSSIERETKSHANHTWKKYYYSVSSGQIHECSEKNAIHSNAISSLIRESAHKLLWFLFPTPTQELAFWMNFSSSHYYFYWNVSVHLSNGTSSKNRGKEDEKKRTQLLSITQLLLTDITHKR